MHLDGLPFVVTPASVWNLHLPTMSRFNSEQYAWSRKDVLLLKNKSIEIRNKNLMTDKKDLIIVWHSHIWMLTLFD